MNGRIIKEIFVSTHDSLSPVQGGGALRTLGVAEEFKRRGYAVTLGAPALEPLLLDEIVSVTIAPPRKQRSQILSAAKFNIRLLLKLARTLKKADLVVIHNTIAAAAMPFFKKVFGFRFVLDITDIHAEYLRIGKRNVFEKVLTPFLLWYEYFIIRSADFVIVATAAMKGLLVEKGVSSEKIEVVYDSVEIRDIPREKEKGSECSILHLGAIDRQHGVETLIRAIPRVLQEVPRAHFFFIGGGRELANMKSLSRRLGVFGACTFSGWLPCRQAREFLRKASIGVIPRDDLPPNRVITTLKIFEYWASGTAVVSSSLEGIREIAYNGQSILWFLAGDYIDLAKKLVLLLTDTAYKEKLIQGGLDAVQRYNFRDAVSRIADCSLRG